MTDLERAVVVLAQDALFALKLEAQRALRDETDEEKLGTMEAYCAALRTIDIPAVPPILDLDIADSLRRTMSESFGVDITRGQAEHAVDAVAAKHGYRRR